MWQSRLSRALLHQPIRPFSSSATKIPLCWLDLRGAGLSVLERLLLEECLLQTDTDRSWLIAGYHDPVRHRYIQHKPSADHNESAVIVMGIGGKVPELLHTDNVRQENVMTIKRFSGGGTVVMDHDAIWTTLIGRPQHFRQVPAFPRPLMEFTADHLFGPLFEKLQMANQQKATLQDDTNISSTNVVPEGQQKTLVMDLKSCSATDNPNRVLTIPRPNAAPTPPPVDSSSFTFSLRENDYVLGERKMGGNAQSITGKGWLHHTSFLWDYNVDNMTNLLQLPKKQPDYRGQRTHDDFLVSLSQVFPHLNKRDFCQLLKQVSGEQFDLVEEMTAGQALDIVRENTGGGGLQAWWETKSRTRIVTDV